MSTWSKEKNLLPEKLDAHDEELPTLSDMIIVKCKDVLCEQSRQLVVIPARALIFKSSGISI